MGRWTTFTANSSSDKESPNQTRPDDAGQKNARRDTEPQRPPQLSTFVRRSLFAQVLVGEEKGHTWSLGLNHPTICIGSPMDCRQSTPARAPNGLPFLGRHTKGYFFFVSRKSGDSARVKTTTSSPVVVLMSWCRLTTFTPVAS